MDKRKRNYTYLKIKAVSLVKGGTTVSDVSKQLEVTHGSVKDWIRTFDEKGLRTLITSRRGYNFRTCKLNAHQVRTLVQAVSSSATECGFPDEYWSPGRVRSYIYKVFGISYSIQQIRPLLAKHGVQIVSERERKALPTMLSIVKTKTPRDYKIQSDNWTLEIIIGFLKEKFGKQYSEDYVRSFFKKNHIRLRRQR